jgi:hypothetical protein
VSTSWHLMVTVEIADRNGDEDRQQLSPQNRFSEAEVAGFARRSASTDPIGDAEPVSSGDSGRADPQGRGN